MGFRRIWECDRCGKEEVVHAADDKGHDHPPGGWQVIKCEREASLQCKLVCRGCMEALWQFIEQRHPAGGH